MEYTENGHKHSNPNTDTLHNHHDETTLTHRKPHTNVQESDQGPQQPKESDPIQPILKRLPTNPPKNTTRLSTTTTKKHSSGKSPTTASPNPKPGGRSRRNTNYFLISSEPDDTPLYGYLLLFATYVVFVCGMYATVVSKWMPITGNKYLDWIREDRYYSFLVPIMLPVTVFFVVINWFGMKFFRHN